MMQEFDLGEDEVRGIFEKYDASQDGFIDKLEYMHLMCPEGYKLPEKNRFGREVFGTILSTHVDRFANELKAEEHLFSQKLSSAQPTPMPSFMLPEVENDMWLAWNKLFESLDDDKDELISQDELRHSGLLSFELCDHLVSLIDPDNPQSFSRDAFLEALLHANNCQWKGFVIW
ncbi:unnamed protein product [Polarella glacialis]|uniref:EF-hand domain-containing protein n=1 Tax=Polarella glacialis TaxID=89957 RepID=A0A813K5H7_POLGL|nr:unnamed protein product [Polarella glacialis]